MVIKRFNANLDGRDFVIGDLHGQMQALRDQMDRLSFDESIDRLFAVGDLVDRGEHSQACLELVREPWFHSVLGNHEEMMCEFFETQTHPALLLWQQNGGDAWAGPDLRKSSEFVELVKLARSLPLAIEVTLRDCRHIGITHAEPPCKDWNDAEEKLEIQWYRHKSLWNDSVKSEGMWSGEIANIDLTVHGHVMFPSAVRRDNSCFIDLGAGLMDAPTGTFRHILHPRLSMFQLEDLFELPLQSTVRAQEAIKKRGG